MLLLRKVRLWSVWLDVIFETSRAEAYLRRALAACARYFLISIISFTTYYDGRTTSMVI